jgi:hypothetical protein
MAGPVWSGTISLGLVTVPILSCRERTGNPIPRLVIPEGHTTLPARSHHRPGHLLPTHRQFMFTRPSTGWYP